MPYNLKIDVSASVPATMAGGREQWITAWVFTPSLDVSREPVPIVACFPGATYDKRYFHMRIEGRADYSMAEFLAAHLETKQQQARELGIQDEKLDAWTAALYNGGSVNVKRMRAGLIGSLKETQKYMKAVPARTAKLEKALG